MAVLPFCLMKMPIRAVWVALVVLCGSAVRAAVPAPGSLFPKDTLVLASVPDWASARTGFLQSAYGRLWSEPAMRPFREKVEAAVIEKLIGDLEKDTGIKVADYLPILQGQVSFALLQKPAGAAPAEEDKDKASSTSALVLIVDAKDQSDVLKQRLTETRQKLTEAKKPLKTEKLRDVEFTTVVIDPKEMKSKAKAKPIAKGVLKADAKDGSKPKDADADDDGDEDDDSDVPARKFELSFGQVGSVLVVTDSLKTVEPLVAVLTGGSAPTLADNEDYRSSVASGGIRDAYGYAWLNFAAVYKTIEQGSDKLKPQANAMGVDPKKALGTLGLQGLKSATISASRTADGEYAVVALNVPESVRGGIFKLLAVEPKDSAPPAFVPADAVRFSRWRIDGPRIWSTLESMIQQISPQLGGFLQMSLGALGKDKDPSFDFRKSFIANLGDDFISYEKAPKGTTLVELSNPPSVSLLGSGNADQLALGFRAAAGLLPTGAEEPKVREFNGRKVYGVKLSMGAPGTDGLFEFAAGSGYVAMGTHPAMLEEFLRSGDGNGKSLRELPALTEAAGRVGGMSQGIFGYEDQREVARAKWEAFRQGDMAKMFPPGTPASQIKSMKEMFDFNLLPPFESVSKYFNLMVYAGRWDPQGFSVKLYSPSVK